jgi:hypothetical protein
LAPRSYYAVDADHQVVPQYAKCAPALQIVLRLKFQIRSRVYGVAEGWKKKTMGDAVDEWRKRNRAVKK